MGKNNEEKLRKSASTEMRQLIGNYLSERKSHTLLSLARKAGISYATIRRIYHGEADASLETQVAILEQIGDQTSRKNYLELYLGHLPLASLAQEQRSGKSNINAMQTLEQYLDSSPYDTLIYFLLLGADLDAARVKKKFGEEGSLAMKKLVAETIVKIRSQKYILSEEIKLKLNEKQYRNWRIKMTLRESLPANAERENWLEMGSAALNSAGTKILLDLYKHTHERALRILMNPEYQGSQRVVVHSFLASLPEE